MSQREGKVTTSSDDKGNELRIRKAGDITSAIPDSFFRDPDEPLNVNYFMKIYAIYDIDSSQQKFTTRVFLSNRHVLTRDEFREYLLCKERDEPWAYDHQWMWPYNAEEVEYEDRFGSPSGKTQEWFVGVMGGKAVSFVQRFAKITWNADFDVRVFPFDSHSLCMILDYGGPRAHIEVDCGFSHYFVKPEGQWSVDDSKVECFPSNGRAVVSVPYCGDTHWDTDFGDQRIVDITDPAKLKKAEVCQEYLQGAYGTMTIFVARNWQFFFWRVYFVMFVVTALTAVVFLFDSLGEQFELLSGALLTTVAYLYYIGTFIPVMKYNTLMDKYIYGLISFKFLIGVQLLSLEFAKPVGGEAPMDVRKQFSFVYFGILVAGHIIYALFVMYEVGISASNRKAWKFEREGKYQELLKQETVKVINNGTKEESKAEDAEGK